MGTGGAMKKRPPRRGRCSPGRHTEKAGCRCACIRHLEQAGAPFSGRGRNPEVSADGPVIGPGGGVDAVPLAQGCFPECWRPPRPPQCASGRLNHNRHSGCRFHPAAGRRGVPSRCTPAWPASGWPGDRCGPAARGSIQSRSRRRSCRNCSGWRTAGRPHGGWQRPPAGPGCRPRRCG